MKKTVSILTTLLLLTTLATGIVSHDIQVHEDDVHINTSFELTGDGEQYNVFSASWQLPRDAELLEIRDTQGEITEYEREDGQVSFDSHSGDAREKETVTLRYILPDKVVDEADQLHTLQLQLPGFSQQETTAQIRTPSPILGTRENPGFQSSYSGRVVNMTGDGPLNTKISYTPREGRYDRYILYGDANLTRADKAFPIVYKISGQPLPFRKIAVVMLPDDEYEQEYNIGYAGVYDGAGIVFVKQSQADRDDFTGLVIHESMHAINQEPLKWVRTESSLFDEGTAKFAEYITNKNLDVRQPEIFGEPVEWTGDCEDSDGRCKYTLPPRGTPEHLWQYYQTGQDFMQSWNPTISGDFAEDLTLRTFGYTYSDLAIRQYVMQNGFDDLHDVYEQMHDVDVAETARQYFDRLEPLLGPALEPCNLNQRDALESCLDEANTYDPDLPESVTIRGREQQIVFTPLETTREDGGALGMDETSSNQSLDRPVVEVEPVETGNLIDRIVAFLQNFINWLRN